MNAIERYLYLVYKIHRHAFKHGCGRETMMYWFKDISKIYFNKTEIRRVIIANSKVAEKNELGYWTFESKELEEEINILCPYFENTGIMVANEKQCIETANMSNIFCNNCTKKRRTNGKAM